MRSAETTLLIQMRAEQREDHLMLVQKVDEGFAKSTAALTAHVAENMLELATLDKRLVPVETMRNTVRWALGAMFSGFVLFVFDLVLNHFPRYVR